MTCHTLKFLNFRMWLKLKIKQQFSNNFKILPTFIFLHREFSVKENKYWLFSKLNKDVRFVLHSCHIALFYCLLFNSSLNSLEFKFKLNFFGSISKENAKLFSLSLSFSIPQSSPTKTSLFSPFFLIFPLQPSWIQPKQLAISRTV